MERRARPARAGQRRQRRRFPGPRARCHAPRRAEHRAADGAAGATDGPGGRPGGPGRPGRAGRMARGGPTRRPIRSAGRCAAATTATTSPSRCRARSTCSVRAASSRSCAGASARSPARSSSSTISSGCSRTTDRGAVRRAGPPCLAKMSWRTCQCGVAARSAAAPAVSASATAARMVASENGLVITSWISVSRPEARSRWSA